MKLDEHKDQFGDFAAGYSKYRRPYNPALFDFIFSVVGDELKKILDIACGTGKSTESLVRNGSEVFGCDIDPLMIEEAKKQAGMKNLNIQYSVAPAEKLPFEDDTFDVVTVGTAFHWFVNKTAIDEILRVLKPGGVLFTFWTWTVKDIPQEDAIPRDFLATFNWARIPKELRDLDYISQFLRDSGFENVSTKQFPDINSYSVEEYVGFMKTASNYGLMSDSEKERFGRELTEILTKQLGTRERFVLEDELRVCYGFKK